MTFVNVLSQCVAHGHLKCSWLHYALSLMFSLILFISVQGYDKYFAGVYCMFRRGFSDPVPNAFDLVITPHVEAHVSVSIYV